MYRSIYFTLLRKFSLNNVIRKKSALTSNSTVTMQGSVVLQVLGSGSRGSPKVVYLFSDHARYLFNCGEGTQRLAHEHKMKLSRLEHMFITSASWENIGGLPGVSLTLQDMGVENITLHGPPGLDELFVATQRFAVLNTMNVTMADCSNGNIYDDFVMSVKYVPLKRKSKIYQESITQSDEEKSFNYEVDNVYYDHEYSGKQTIKQRDMQSLLALPKKDSFISVSFICRLKDRLGVLDLQKCVNKGVKPGPLLGQLKNGLDVTLSDGTIVYANEVKTPDKPGSVFIVIDVPEMEYLDSLLECKDFKMHQEKTATKNEDIPVVIVHFSPSHVLQSDEYQSFMRSFPTSTNHLIVNDTNDSYGSIDIHRLQQKLHLLDNQIFPPIDCCNKYYSGYSDCHEELKKIKLDNDTETNSNNPNDANMNMKTENQIIQAKTLTLYRLSPKQGLERSLETKVNTSEYISEVFAQEGFPESLKKFHSTVSNAKKYINSEKYPTIVFLGTGSCIPNKTRNTSGIIVHVDENNCILLDCGEGTFGQMSKFYGAETINILRKLKTIYISHLHADHHIGLIQVLQGWKKALVKENRDVGGSFQKLFLLAPKQMQLWLQLYDKRFEKINDIFDLIPNQMFEKMEKSPEEQILNETILKKNNLSDLKTCFVKHCPNAFGITIVTNEGKKVTYSGDTMPCENLIKMGFKSDILIHEATMEDDLYTEAVKKLHSTTGQAIEISKKMQARNTILTHFSQRYARIPRFSEETEKLCYTNNIGIAFDNMKIAFEKLHILPHMYPPLKLMFADHYEELENRAAKRALKRSRSSNKDLEKNVLKKNKQKSKNL